MVMNDLQKVEFELLKIYIDFCEKHNLRYFLVGGSALGAVRHQGFIPWDDDVDVAMPREDYDKFIELGKKEFVGEIFLQTYETDPEYPYNFAKLRNSKTTFVEWVYQFTNMNHGVWIDIFPLDGISKKQGKINFAMKWRIYRIWPRLLLIGAKSVSRYPRKWWWILDILLDIILLPFMLFNIGHFMNKRIDKIMRKKKYEDCYYVANMQGAWFGREIVKREYFGNGTKAMFEGMEVMIPEKYDEFLTSIYGNYMKLPPIEKQVGKHNHAGYSLEIPYNEFKKNYKKGK
jgi:lipopolysaccharide cholinephosphotransferase